MLRSLHSIADKQQCKKLLCNGCFRKKKKKDDKASGKPHRAIANQHLVLINKNNWNTKEDKVYSYVYCDWQKGTSQEEAMSSSEEIKPIALSIVELRLAEAIS